MLSPSAERWGELWGARAEAWAEQEAQNEPLYREALRVLAPGPGAAVLDVGCGSGSFCRVAADAGAQVAGVDASEPLLAIARRRVPEGEFRRGELEALPFPDDGFDAVTGFNAFQFAADTVAALREAARVARPGGRVLALVWGRPERCELVQALRALAPLRPAPPAAGPAFGEPGVLEAAAAEAGLAPAAAGEIVAPFEWPDEAAMLRGLLSAANAVEAARHSGEERVAATLVEAMAPFRLGDGGYRVENEFRYVVARAP